MNRGLGQYGVVTRISFCRSLHQQDVGVPLLQDDFHGSLGPLIELGTTLHPEQAPTSDH
jgi:hypothetical protein